MKRMLVILLCAVAQGLHASPPEEVRRIIREAVEVRGDPGTLENMERWKRLVPELKAFDRDDKWSVLSAYCEILSERFNDLNPRQLEHIMLSFSSLDGSDLTSYGNQEALDCARRIVREQVKGAGSAYGYLSRKGDARDLDILTGTRRDDLAARVAGTNLVFTDPSLDHLWRSCVPSVTNTGPQGAYVSAILKQFWNTLEVEYHSWEDGRRYPYRDKSKIPDELLTMVVWFDEDGNPVCNVDLSKYGLTMPEIDLPQNVRDEILRRARPEMATASLPSEDEAQRLESVATEPSPLPEQP